ncbi:MAG: hypothetical protein IKK34_07105 [Clostridia bacterium]|nr:hypothetical protein [Clostridia bacterium]
MTTGLTPRTFENLQLNAGAFLKNFAYDTATDKGTLENMVLAALESGDGVLGATRGGGSFQCTPTVRQIEADGMRYPVIGSTVNDMWTIKLTTTLLEITPENFADALMCCDVAKSGAKTTLTVRTSIEKEDYIPSLCWVGDTSKGLVLIELKNALNLAGANFTFTDRGEGTLPVEFQAHQANLADMDKAPFNIVFFDETV